MNVLSLKKWRKSYLLLALLSVIGLIFGLVGILVSIPTAVVTYEITTDKIANPIRFAVVSDLHSCDYGEGQGDLINLISNQNPDIILFPGDIIDDEMPDPQKAVDVLFWAGEHYPSYYVTGNHEIWIDDLQWVYDTVEGCGVTVLSGTTVTLEQNGDSIHIFGVDDPSGGETAAQLSTLSVGNGYNLLLAHRPEQIDTYAEMGFDLAVSGHAHGGQWRIPGILNGLLAPNQGLFPQYAGGHYLVGDTDFVVSRGLARESTRIPRIYNPPELVIIDLVPER